MLCGPSGVGKTETALTLAEALYGGEQNVITINMSEFQEAHTVSTLKGSPPGYVGYGEGGVLTEAVRRRPYSVVLLDEVEKAHSDVHELFFQVFDKGWMEDGEGRRIDFKNTIILLTSNVGTELIMSMCKDPELMPEPEGIAKALREPLLKKFPAALLGRLVVIPYYPLSDAMLAEHRPPAARTDREARGRASQDSVHLRRRGGEADRQPVHRGRERRAHDRRDPHQHRAAGDQPRVPHADDGRRGAERRAAGAWPTAISSIGSSRRECRDASDARLIDTAWSSRRQRTAPSAWTKRSSIAIQLQQNEQWTAADDIYRRILEVAPDHADALHYSGVLAHQQGRSDEAVALIERSLELEPDRADWHSNLGIVLQGSAAARRGDRRVPARDRARSDHANAHNNLGVLLRAQGKPVEAEAAYRTAIRVEPEHSDAYTNLGILLNGQKRTHEAVVCFCKVITLRPKHPEARRLLALAHCTLGEVDKAVEIFEEWLEEEPDDPDRPAHARGVLRPRRAGAGVGRVRRDDLRQLRRQLRCQAREAVVPRAGAGRGDAGGRRASSRRRASTCSMPAAAPGCAARSRAVCAPAGRRRSVGAACWRRPRTKQVYDELFKVELTAYLRD